MTSTQEDLVEPPRPREPEPDPRVLRELSALRDSLDRRGAEIDVLQVEAAKKSRPFYREPAAIIAALALVASLIATVLSQGNSITDRQIGQRGRLTTIIKEISDWYEMSLDTKTYGIQYETGVRPALNEANFLINALEDTDLRSTAPEKAMVSVVLREVFEPVLSLELAQRAELQARDGTLAEKVLTSRNLATSFFNDNKPAQGNFWFQQTVDHVRASAGLLNRQNLASYLVSVHQQWVGAALGSNDCGVAARVVAEARSDLSLFPITGPGNYGTQQDTLEGQVRTLCPGR